MKIARHHAFTLIELLVVIIIIAMFLGMAMPAVNGLREMGRRTSCQSHLARMSVALHNYEAAYGVLPPGTVEPKGPIRNVAEGNHMSWIVALLPYIDENVTFKHVDFSVGAYDSKNAAVRDVHIALLACPSDRGGRPDIAATNYAGCHHDVESPIDGDNHGVLFLNSHVAADDVTHGLTHTIFLGEKRVDADDLGWMSGTRATLRNTGTPINFVPRPAPTPKQAPPVSALFVGGFSSAHAGSANFLFGDGAVRLVTSDIDTDVYQQLGNRAGGKLLSGGPTREE